MKHEHCFCRYSTPLNRRRPYRTSKAEPKVMRRSCEVRRGRNLLVRGRNLFVRGRNLLVRGRNLLVRRRNLLVRGPPSTRAWLATVGAERYLGHYEFLPVDGVGVTVRRHRNADLDVAHALPSTRTENVIKTTVTHINTLIYIIIRYYLMKLMISNI